LKRPVKELSFRLEHHVNSYALAASAAGVGILALVQPVEAKIIYTPAHRSISHTNPIFYLDVNHDGVRDFLLSHTSYFGENSSAKGIEIHPQHSGDGILGQSHWASALTAGVQIGSSGEFLSVDNTMARHSFWDGSDHFVGAWANGGKGVKNRYLGLKFVIRGKVHYGWARLNVRVFENGVQVAATLTGYAYETIPGKPIIAGKTHGKDVITVEPASLGHLARGASAVSTWRGPNSAK